ncbi:MAG: hypothetical protein WBK99_01835 [Solirubrobacterales bacterium]
MIANAAARVLANRAVQLATLAAIASAGVLLLSLSSPRAAGGGTFAPTVELQVSTTRATAHPDARLTVTVPAGDEAIKDLTIDLPKGLWGSLNAAAPCGEANALAGTCPPASKVGTVIADAKVDQSDARLRGTVYLTEAVGANAATDPAGLSVVVEAVVGGIDLGSVIVPARAVVRTAAISPTAPTGAVGAIEGIRVVANDIPKSIGPTTDTDGRTIEFQIMKLAVDLRSNQSPPYSPLLTNPSVCSAIGIGVSGSATSYDGTVKALAGPTGPTPPTMAIDGCDTVKFVPTAFSVSAATPAAGAATGLSVAIDFPENSASLNRITVKLPPQIGPNFPSFGASGDMCPSTAAPIPTSPFAPSVCPSQARVGSVTIETPLLPDPVGGDVYLINKSPIPWLGIDVHPGIAGNPKGVYIRLTGSTALPQVDPTCDGLTTSLGFCQSQISASFFNIPDAPISSIDLSLDGPSRAGIGGPLPGQIVTVADASDATCRPVSDFTASLVSNSGSSVASEEISPQAFTGCDPRIIEIESSVSSPVGRKTTTNPPSFTFSGGSGPYTCAIDGQESAVEPCTSPYTPAAVTGALHRLYVQNETRAFVVAPVPAVPDPTAPSITAIDSGPSGSTADTTPGWAFTADESSKFQCAIDDGAFLPCNSAPPALTGAFQVAAEDEFVPGSAHKFEVRAQDAAGNVGTPATRNITVNVPFEPAFSATVSTNVARSHPDLDVIITNPSEQDLQETTIKLPDGFFGGLQGVQSICPLAVAAAGNCTVASRVGTVEAEAVVDESFIRVDGTVYLTDGVNGDPAGLSIKVPAVIQEIDLGDVIVAARVAVRDKAKGMDALVVGIPRSIVPPAGSPDTETFFNIRKITLKLRTGVGAAQPLLTNPSACTTTNFQADFRSYSSSSTSASQSLPIAGCEALAFAPSLTAKITQPDGSIPTGEDFKDINLTANLTASPNESGIRSASILMPKPVTINVLKLPLNICEQQQYETLSCPAESIIGSATATSPLLLPGETLTGPVYLLRGENFSPLPRLFIRLGGRISLSVVGKSSFEPGTGTQIRAVFDDLPDAPLSTFSLGITNLLSTVKKPCKLGDKYGRSMTGTIFGHNNKQAAVLSTFDFDCAGVAIKHRFKKRGEKTTLGVTVQTQGSQAPVRRIRLQFHKYLTLNKRAVKRKLIIKGDGRRIKPKCFTVKRASVLEVGFCGKRYRNMQFSFRAGSLAANRKLKNPKLTMTVTPGPYDSRQKDVISLKKPLKRLTLP